MRICLVARNRFHGDKKALATYTVLQRAGHEIDVVAIDAAEPRHPVTRTVARRIGPRNTLGGLLNRLAPEPVVDRLLQSRLAAACAATAADVFLPLHPDALQAAVTAARRTGGVVQRWPGMPHAGNVDLIALAPASPDVAAPVHGLGSAYTPADVRAPNHPSPNRYKGETAVLCYRKTAANPGRYVEAALIRAGLNVRVETEGIDLSSLDPGTRFVLFVEGPYPALEVVGATRVPVLFWAHHGEHHLYANLRLAERYGADSVLLAHSWHLAHWFPAPVHRFPFAVAPELFGPPKGLDRRRFDVAMVGSKLRGEAWQYERRRRIVSSLESALPADRVAFVEGVAPEEMAALYGDSRVVINEGGARHFPITMRVFETLGAGAALLTDPAPGIEVLLDPGDHYTVITDDVSADVGRLLANLDRTQRSTELAREHALAHHTYDHRIDDLMSIAQTTTKREPSPSTTTTDLGRLIDRDVEVQRLVQHGCEELVAQLPDREVWSLDERRDGRLAPASMDAAVIRAGSTAGLEAILGAARIRIYAEGDIPGLSEYLAARHPDAVIENSGALRRVDLMAESYRAQPAEDR